jgi:hypothetical protein
LGWLIWIRGGWTGAQQRVALYAAPIPRLFRE